MPRAYERYTKGLHRAWLIALWAAVAVGCDANASESSPDAQAEDAGEADAAADLSAQLAEATAKLEEAAKKLAEAEEKLADQAEAAKPQDAGAPALLPPESDCAGLSCIGNSAQLADYCDEPFARCPATFAELRTLACANGSASGRQQFKSSCGGPGIRIEYSYGMLDYHYDRAGTLQAVTTFLNKTSAACQSDIYLYGDSGCRAGVLEPVTCTP